MNEIAAFESALPVAYRSMIADIRDALPAIARDSANFHKSHSQFMVSTLDVTALTPLRAIKHTLAEIHRARRGLEEAHVKRLGLVIDEREERQKLEVASGAERERIAVRLVEIGYQLAALDELAQGAIRKLSHLCAMHKSLLAHIGKDHITEADYESEEVRYHVLTCLKQALCAARARNGVIDEGNHIYLFDMGLPAGLVQQQIVDYLKSEQALLNSGQAPTHAHTLDWMNKVADLIEPLVAENAVRRGVVINEPSALLGAR